MADESHNDNTAAATQADDFGSMFVPGVFVEHTEHSDWGIGQVQSNAGGKITVNFEHIGKVVLSGQARGLVLRLVAL